jgi:hypothetical protein
MVRRPLAPLSHDPHPHELSWRPIHKKQFQTDARTADNRLRSAVRYIVPPPAPAAHAPPAPTPFPRHHPPPPPPHTHPPGLTLTGQSPIPPALHVVAQRFGIRGRAGHVDYMEYRRMAEAPAGLTAPCADATAARSRHITSARSTIRRDGATRPASRAPPIVALPTLQPARTRSGRTTGPLRHALHHILGLLSRAPLLPARLRRGSRFLPPHATRPSVLQVGTRPRHRSSSRGGRPRPAALPPPRQTPRHTGAR